MRSVIRKLVPKKVRKLLGARSDFCQASFAQEGEDRILWALLRPNGRKSPGFYVDVGAHHPERYSNTFLFYLTGWMGINIDAMPGSMLAFQRERPRDINIEAAIGEEEKTLTYFEFNEPALNGFCREVAMERKQLNNWKLIGERPVSMVPLEQLLDEHLPKSQKVDFMSIDVEGFDLEVLKSNNWSKVRPTVVLVEDGERDERTGDSKITSYMRTNGYLFCCKTLLTTFFIDPHQIESTPAGFRQCIATAGCT